LDLPSITKADTGMLVWGVGGGGEWGGGDEGMIDEQPAAGIYSNTQHTNASISSVLSK